MKKTLALLVLVLFSGCAGFERGCASWNAEQFGSDWIVLQYDMGGAPINCWKLSDTSIVNEPGSDGIYWKGSNGHLVHISGWYNRVQVAGRLWDSAAHEVGIDLARCVNGKYLPKRPDPPPEAR